MYSPATTIQIISFIRSIGISVDFAVIEQETVLPGVTINNGGLVVDAEKLKHPGDLLHEAGHIAVTPQNKRPELSDNVDTHAQQGGEEMAAIAWSYAACKHLGLDSRIVFHEDGYKGESEGLIENFDNGTYIAVPLLQWHGMTLDEKQAARQQVKPYPHMVNWVSQQ